MASKTTGLAVERRAPSWNQWRGEHRELLAKMTERQRVMVEAAVRFVAAMQGHATLVRMVAFFLLHADTKLSPAQVGAAVGRTDRAMRTLQSLDARALLDSIWSAMGRHRRPKLSAEHAGPIALHLMDHPGCTLGEMVSFIRRSFDIQVDPLTLRRFFKTYGLGVLREDRHREGDDERPFASGGRAMAARSSSSRGRSR